MKHSMIFHIPLNQESWFEDIRGDIEFDLKRIFKESSIIVHALDETIVSEKRPVYQVCTASFAFRQKEGFIKECYKSVFLVSQKNAGHADNSTIARPDGIPYGMSADIKIHDIVIEKEDEEGVFEFVLSRMLWHKMVAGPCGTRPDKDSYKILITGDGRLSLGIWSYLVKRGYRAERNDPSVHKGYDFIILAGRNRDLSEKSIRHTLKRGGGILSISNSGSLHINEAINLLFDGSASHIFLDAFDEGWDQSLGVRVPRSGIKSIHEKSIEGLYITSNIAANSVGCRIAHRIICNDIENTY